MSGLTSRRIARDVVEKTLIDGATITATVAGSAVTAQNVKDAQFFLTVASFTGLTSIDIKLQCQDPKTLAWFDLGIAFTQATDNTSEMKINIDDTNFNHIPLGKMIRAYSTVVGTGSAVVTLYMVGKT